MKPRSGDRVSTSVEPDLAFFERWNIAAGVSEDEISIYRLQRIEASRAHMNMFTPESVLSKDVYR